MPFENKSNVKHIQKICSQYPDNVIIGVYNKKNKTIYLAPSIDNKANDSKVWLLRSEDGTHWSKGWVSVDINKKLHQGDLLSQSQINKFNSNLQLVPRAYTLYVDEASKKHYPAHGFFINELLKEQEHVDDYFGFSLTTTNGVLDRFTDESGFLNSRNEQGLLNRDPQGNIIRTRGAKLPPEVKEEVLKLFDEVAAQEKQVQSIRNRFFLDSETKKELPEQQLMRNEKK